MGQHCQCKLEEVNGVGNHSRGNGFELIVIWQTLWVLYLHYETWHKTTQNVDNLQSPTWKSANIGISEPVTTVYDPGGVTTPLQ